MLAFSYAFNLPNRKQLKAFVEGLNPSPGDVLIAPDSGAGYGYTLSTAPDGPSQLRYPSYEQALRTAIKWASRSGVSVWRANGNATFERVHPPES